MKRNLPPVRLERNQRQRRPVAVAEREQDADGGPLAGVRLGLGPLISASRFAALKAGAHRAGAESVARLRSYKQLHSPQQQRAFSHILLTSEKSLVGCGCGCGCVPPPPPPFLHSIIDRVHAATPMEGGAEGAFARARCAHPLGHVVERLHQVVACDDVFAQPFGH